MKTNLVFTAVMLATSFSVTGAAPQTNQQNPMPVVPAMAPRPEQIIYSAKLPEPSDLTEAATAQGSTVEQIIRTSEQETVIYRGPDGTVHTVAYQLLPANSGVSTLAASGLPAVPSAIEAPPTSAGNLTAVPTDATTIVYAAPTAAYYYCDPFYYPWPWIGGAFFSVGPSYGYHHYRGRPDVRHFRGAYGFRRSGVGPSYYRSGSSPSSRASSGGNGSYHH